MKGTREKICNIEDTAQLSSLTSNAAVTCGRCGAKANDPASVCDPVQFPDAGTFGD
jgi:hypothetical protein